MRKLLRIPWTRLASNKQVYEMAESELLSHAKDRNLLSFGLKMRIADNSIETMVCFVKGTRGRGRARIGQYWTISERRVQVSLEP